MRTKGALAHHILAIVALIAANGLFSAYAQANYAIITLAGSVGNSGTNDGVGSGAKFYSPFGIAADADGNIYVADYYNYTIRKVTPGGVVTTLAGKAGEWGVADGTGSQARFEYPYGIAVDGAGNVYVTDSSNNTIRKVTPSGVTTTLAGDPDNSGSVDGTNNGARFYVPTGIAVDSAGNLYVADNVNNMIRKVTPLGTNWVVTTLAGRAGSSGTNDGVGDTARFKSPFSVAVDAGGNVYVADTDNHMIRKVTPAGVVTTLAGMYISSYGGYADGTNTDARFQFPVGLALDNKTNIYVIDTNNQLVRKITPVGADWVTTTLAGALSQIGTNDGIGGAARFNYPHGIAVDIAGNIYVGDSFNYTIRKGTILNPSPVITTSGPNFGFKNGKFGFDLTGTSGQVVVVEFSSNLQSWNPVKTNVIDAGATYFSDPQSSYSGSRFYRAKLQ